MFNILIKFVRYLLCHLILNLFGVLCIVESITAYNGTSILIRKLIQSIFDNKIPTGAIAKENEEAYCKSEMLYVWLLRINSIRLRQLYANIEYKYYMGRIFDLSMIFVKLTITFGEIVTAESIAALRCLILLMFRETKKTRPHFLKNV